MPKTVTLKVTSAFLVGGQIAKVGDVVDVNETDAKSLLHRGKAVLHVEYREKPEGDDEQTGETQQADAETNPAESVTEPAEAETRAAAAEQPAEQPAAPAKAKGGKKGK